MIFGGRFLGKRRSGLSRAGQNLRPLLQFHTPDPFNLKCGRWCGSVWKARLHFFSRAAFVVYLFVGKFFAETSVDTPGSLKYNPNMGTLIGRNLLQDICWGHLP